MIPFGSTTTLGLHEGHYDSGVDLIRPDGWFLATFKLGHNPDDHWGFDFSRWTIHQTLGAIARLNHGYGSDGTFPTEDLYTNFSKRVRNFVNASRGCKRWIIGNEPNHSTERPNGISISPAQAAKVYLSCRDQIKNIPGHADDIVIPPPVAAWNPETGWFLDYWRIMTNEIGWRNIDGIGLHTYTHGRQRETVRSDLRVQFGAFGKCFYQFRVFEDLLSVVPDVYKTLPVYITETNPGADPNQKEWPEYDNGWIREVYELIREWNENNQVIRAVILYRWPRFDPWVIEGNKAITEAIKYIRDNRDRYRWDVPRQPPISLSRKDYELLLTIRNNLDDRITDLEDEVNELSLLLTRIGK